MKWRLWWRSYLSGHSSLLLSSLSLDRSMSLLSLRNLSRLLLSNSSSLSPIGLEEREETVGQCSNLLPSCLIPCSEHCILHYSRNNITKGWHVNQLEHSISLKLQAWTKSSPESDMVTLNKSVTNTATGDFVQIRLMKNSPTVLFTAKLSTMFDHRWLHQMNPLYNGTGTKTKKHSITGPLLYLPQGPIRSVRYHCVHRERYNSQSKLNIKPINQSQVHFKVAHGHETLHAY